MAKNFIQVISNATTGVLGSLPRSMVCVTREPITGYVADPNSGLITITAAMVAAFITANPTAYGTIQFLNTAFAGSVQDSQVYILSTNATALTAAMLNKANYSPRSWSFFTVVSQSNGLSDSATFLADCGVASTWATPALRKIFFHTWNMINGGTLPAALLLGGSLAQNSRTITLVTNAVTLMNAGTVSVSQNPLQAALCWCLYGGSIARSIGSLSDCHDLPGVSSDTYDATTRAMIASNSLAQYNGAQDQAGSLFVYDTTMNCPVNPPTTPQVESIIAQDYINDYVTIYVRNSLQAAGQTGVEASMKGVNRLYSLVTSALETLWSMGAIQSDATGKGAYQVVQLSQDQITALNAAWMSSGVIPTGSIVGSIKAFAAAHYVTIVFNFA